MKNVLLKSHIIIKKIEKMKKPGLKEPDLLIDSIITKSKEVLFAKIVIKQQRNTKLLMSFFKNRMLMGLDNSDNIIKEMNNLILEKERDIKFLMKPLLKGENFLFPNKYSLSGTDLRNGYSVLQKIVSVTDKGEPNQTLDYALLLSDIIENKKENPFYPDPVFRKGSLISMNEHRDMIEKFSQPIKFNLKDFIEKSIILKYISIEEFKN